VAKYETANGAPNFNDVVFAFANVDRDNNQSGTFNVNITQGPGNLFGIKPGRFYNVKNLAAYTGADANRRNVWLWPGGGSWGSNVLANGIFVGANKVPATDAAWTNAPFEAQYLKLYDVTPPPTPATPVAVAYVVGTNVTFSWNAVSDAEGGISGYHLIVGTTPGGSNVFNGTVTTTNQIASGSYGQTLYARVAAINNAGIEGSFSAVTSGTILLDPKRRLRWRRHEQRERSCGRHQSAGCELRAAHREPVAGQVADVGERFRADVSSLLRHQSADRLCAVERSCDRRCAGGDLSRYAGHE
jgi:hypothetical protein